MGKLFQIHEEDLSTLESDLPAVFGRHMPCINNADRAVIRHVQRILADVRWNYGPWTDVTEVTGDDDDRDDKFWERGESPAE